MQRGALSLLVAAGLTWLGTITAGAAASTTTTIQSVNLSFVDQETCPFTIDSHIQGSFMVTDFFDASGVLVKSINTPTGGPTTVTFTNPANGKTATTEASTTVVIMTFNPDGSVNTTSLSGISSNFIVAGSGTVFLEVGTIEFDSQGNIVRAGGQLSSVAGLCAALA
jgi:hypothetical protein